MRTRQLLLALSLIGLSQLALAAPMTMEEAVARATAAHPGQVVKAYQEVKRGQEVWEVKINGEDGKRWEIYYAADTGELIKEEMDD